MSTRTTRNRTNRSTPRPTSASSMRNALAKLACLRVNSASTREDIAEGDILRMLCRKYSRRTGFTVGQ